MSRVLLGARAIVVVLGVVGGIAGCGGIDLGDNPGKDVRKETGPLTVPPPGVRAGTAP